MAVDWVLLAAEMSVDRTVGELVSQLDVWTVALMVAKTVEK